MDKRAENVIFEQFPIGHYNNKQQNEDIEKTIVDVYNRPKNNGSQTPQHMAVTQNAYLVQIHEHNPITITNKIRVHLKANPIINKTGHLVLKLIHRPIHPFILNINIQSILSHQYKNEQIVRQKYRIEQQQHSSIQLRIRRFIFELAYWIEKNIFFAQILFNNQTKKLVLISQAILRTQQYRLYMRDRDRKFQMMDLGVMEKYPFPDMKDVQ